MGFLVVMVLSALSIACGSGERDARAPSGDPRPTQDDKGAVDDGAKKREDGARDGGGERDDAADRGRAPARFGAKFAAKYRTEYDAVAAEVGFTKDACSAFASRALRRAGVDVPYELWAPSLVDHLERAGWRKITASGKLLKGDLVFTRDEQTAVDGLTNHVFVFAGYAGGGKTRAYAIDNRGNGYVRNLGAGEYSPFWFAYRHP